MKSLLAILAVLALSGAAFSLTNISSCSILSTPGETYQLTQDIQGAPNFNTPAGGVNCIKIAAADIVFDCMGFSITDNGTVSDDRYGIVLNDSATNVTVQNCPSISQYNGSVLLLNGDGNTVRNVTSHDNNFVGFFISGVGGDVSENNILTNNTASDSQYGFYVVGSQGNNLSWNDAFDNFAGFELIFSAQNNLFENNEAFLNTHGIEFRFSGNDFNNFTGNFVHDNVLDGFNLTLAANNIFSNNTVTGNGDEGFDLLSMTSNNFSGNTVDSNTGNGFHLNLSIGNFFEFNSASGNGADGFRFIGSGSYIMANDTASSNGGNGMSFNSSLGGIIQNATVTSNGLDGLAFVSSPGGIPQGNDVSGNFGNGISMVSSGGKILSNNVISGNGDDGIYSNASGGSIIDQNLIFSNSGNGIAVYDAAGGIYGPNSVYGNGLNGMLISNVNATIFSSSNISNSTLSGIRVEGGSDGLIIDSNHVNGNAEGISIGNAGGNILDNNTVFGHAGVGLSILDTNGTVLAEGHFYDNSPDFTVSGAGISFSMDGAVFDSPAGVLANYTNLSINDTVDSAYSIDHDVQPAPLPAGRISFAQKFVNITNLTANVSIDSISWHWQEGEVVVPYSEPAFELWRFNGVEWSNQFSALDSTANTLSEAALSDFSVFAILQAPADDDGDEDGGEAPEEEVPEEIPECTSNDQCAVNEVCSAGVCTPFECGCGFASNHSC
ncbi:MAG: right-handed parallel beta-helix repeat-containing protein, partial [Candidatus Micrarchaeota archaeon]